MSCFHATRIVRFGHCDPAGIIFYPRYFDLIHEVKEDWFREALDWSFAKSIGAMRKGFPIVRLASEFHAPSRLGEDLLIVLSVPHLGRSSIAIDYEVSCGGEQRAEMRTVVVHVDLADGRARPIADELRERIERFRGRNIGTP
ncbi:MAG: acyl-CoA thioesterase [Pseudomonadota bacterium]|nr:acyl-CoA thioesterase [Pseudomonadota bacterium]